MKEYNFISIAVSMDKISEKSIVSFRTKNDYGVDLNTDWQGRLELIIQVQSEISFER